MADVIRSESMIPKKSNKKKLLSEFLDRNFFFHIVCLFLIFLYSLNSIQNAFTSRDFFFSAKNVFFDPPPIFDFSTPIIHFFCSPFLEYCILFDFETFQKKKKITKGRKNQFKKLLEMEALLVCDKPKTLTHTPRNTFRVKN